MPDRLDKIRVTLAELETELAEVERLDDRTREQLAHAAEEIAATLRRGTRSERTSDLESSLRDRVLEFEASHPQLAGIVTRLIDGLGQLGI